MRLFRWLTCAHPTSSAALTAPPTLTTLPAPGGGASSASSAAQDSSVAHDSAVSAVPAFVPRTAVELHPEYAHSEPYYFTAGPDKPAARRVFDARRHVPHVPVSVPQLDIVGTSPTSASPASASASSPTSSTPKKPHEDTISLSRLSTAASPPHALRKWRRIMRRPLEVALRNPVKVPVSSTAPYRGRLSLCDPPRAYERDNELATQRLSLSDMPRPRHNDDSFRAMLAHLTPHSDTSSARSDDQSVEPDNIDNSAFFATFTTPVKSVGSSAMSSSSSLSVSTVLPLVAHRKRSFGRTHNVAMTAAVDNAAPDARTEVMAMFADAEDDAVALGDTINAHESDRQRDSSSSHQSSRSSTHTAPISDAVMVDRMLSTEIQVSRSVSTSCSDHSSEYRPFPAYDSFRHIEESSVPASPTPVRDEYEENSSRFDDPEEEEENRDEEEDEESGTPVNPDTESVVARTGPLTTVFCQTLEISPAASVSSHLNISPTTLAPDSPGTCEPTEHPSFARTIAAEMRANGLSSSRKTSMPILRWRGRDDDAVYNAQTEATSTRSLGMLSSPRDNRQTQSGLFKRMFRAATKKGSAISTLRVPVRRKSTDMGSGALAPWCVRRNSVDSPATRQTNTAFGTVRTDTLGNAEDMGNVKYPEYANDADGADDDDDADDAEYPEDAGCPEDAGEVDYGHPFTEIDTASERSDATARTPLFFERTGRMDMDAVLRR